MKINDRRLINHSLINFAKVAPEKVTTVCVSIDKLDKEHWDKVEEELIRKEIA